MGVTTTADEKLQSAKDHIGDAVKDLREFLDPDTWGNADYKEEFLEEVEQVYVKLCKIKRKMK